MRGTVRLFAGRRERAGADSLALELPEAARVADVLADAQVRALTGAGSVVVAVNRRYADPGRALAAGDELALIPPVSGGAPIAAVHVAITDGPLSLDGLVARVRDPRAGALVTFTGVTREVDHLDYEAYREMALVEMRRVVEAAVATHGLCAAAAEHRTGRVALGEASVAIAVSAPHRAEAFAGGRAVIDALKSTVPVWKREEGQWAIGSLPPTPN